MLFILREPFGVAKSFDARANNPADRWPAGRNCKVAIKRCNTALAAINRAREQDLLEIHVVCHEDLFLKKDGLNEMFHFLGVDPARLGNTDDIFEKAQTLADNGRLSEMAQAVAMGVDFDAHRKTMQLGRQGKQQHTFR